MNPMTPLTPGLPPVQPVAAPQTPQSQYLAAALKQLSASAPATPAALGMNLASEAMLRSAQQREANYGPNGTNAQTNAASDSLAKSLAGIGIPNQQTPALPTSAPKPFSGLLGLGKMFGGGYG